TCRRWPHAGHGFLVSASLAGDSSGFLQFGQLYLIGGCGLLSSVAIIVLFRFDAAGAGVGAGAAGTCKRCPHSGHGFLISASLAGASNGFLQRGQLNLIGGAVSPASPRIVFW